MEYFEGNLCIAVSELTERVMTQGQYQGLRRRGLLEVARRGGGRGSYALVNVDSLPTEFRSKAAEMYPDGDLTRLRGWVESHYEIDQKAVAWFHNRGNTGLDLAPEKIHEYVVNASVLNCCLKLYECAATAQKLMGSTYDWDKMAATVELLRKSYGHTLPGSMQRFKKKAHEYKRGGYAALVSSKFGNQNTRKVDVKTERLILSLAVLPTKPYNKTVHQLYMMFVTAELDVYDLQTGALFDPNDFTDADGEPQALSESTIANYLNKPKNKLLVQAALESRMTFMHEQMPHVHRHAGRWSLSQITMDDVDLTRKLRDTKQRVHAYYAYDVVSGCVIGAAYARRKDEGLVVDCFRDMFRTIERHGWGMPAGIEVENHLMTQYKEGFLQAGVAFPFVHFCAPQNSQEKYAEALNGAKKRSVIKRNHEGIGRWYAKDPKYRVESQKVSDATNDTYEDARYYTWDELVADDRRDSLEWNNSLHPDQKRYPGKTRWQVLEENVNPDLRPLDRMTLARYIGVRVETSVKRNSTVRVAGFDWWLSDTKVLQRLRPNDYSVTAYYLPDEDGSMPKDIYLYQGDRYVDTPSQVETFNRVYAEQTPEDRRRFQEQQKKIASFRSYVRENAVARVGLTTPLASPVANGGDPPEPLEVAPTVPPAQGFPEPSAFNPDDWAARALEDF